MKFKIYLKLCNIPCTLVSSWHWACPFVWAVVTNCVKCIEVHNSTMSTCLSWWQSYEKYLSKETFFVARTTPMLLWQPGVSRCMAVHPFSSVRYSLSDTSETTAASVSMHPDCKDDFYDILEDLNWCISQPLSFYPSTPHILQESSRILI